MVKATVFMDMNNPTEEYIIPNSKLVAMSKPVRLKKENGTTVELVQVEELDITDKLAEELDKGDYKLFV